jgi:hypothetical protein
MPKYGVLVYLLLGVALGVAAMGIYSGAASFPPSDHQAVANTITVYDLGYQRAQTLSFIRSGQGQQMAIIPMSPFRQNVNYQYSLWEFKVGVDTNAVMQIWGPGDDGATYNVGIGRLCGNQLRITWPTGSFDFNGTNTGYVSFDVTRQPT